jgi:hypothetical protein
MRAVGFEIWDTRRMETATPVADRVEFGRRPVNNRAKVSNGTRLLSGIDGRTAEARRYRDLVISLADDFGGPDAVSEAAKTIIRSAAANIVASEKVQAAIVRGEPVDLEQATRLSNVTARLVARLAAMRKARKTATDSPLAAHFAKPPAPSTAP